MRTLGLCPSRLRRGKRTTAAAARSNGEDAFLGEFTPGPFAIEPCDRVDQEKIVVATAGR